MMTSKKFFIWPVVISLVGHVALIAASSFVDLRENVKAADIFSVRITPADPPLEPKWKEEKKTDPPPPLQTPKAKVPPPQSGKEDTVDLGSSDVKYAAYLAGVKKKILRGWVASDVYRNHESGSVVVLISVNADGSLAYLATTSPSGRPDLDRQTLEVISAAAPFRPLPPQYDLSRLHITASFQYGADP